jgi:hypothetical protein
MALELELPFDDNDGNITAHGTVGADAFLGGGSTTAEVSHAGPGGDIPRSFELNGVDDDVDFSGAGLSYATNEAFSYCLWFRSGSTFPSPLLGRTANSESSVVQTSDTNIRVRYNNSNADFTVPSLGSIRWHHLLLVRSTSNSLRLYVDGVQASGTTTKVGTFEPTHVGRLAALPRILGTAAPGASPCFAFMTPTSSSAPLT